MPEDLNKGKRSALGKGLNALFDSPSSEKAGAHGAPPTTHVLHVAPTAIDPNPQQPRKHFRDDDLAELTESIRVNGIIQPLVVSKGQVPGRYVLIAGERRLRGALAANLDLVPIVLREGTSEEMLRIALIENIQRSDLNIIEEACAYEKLINKFGLTQEQCALRVGKDRSSIANAIRLLTLPAMVQNDLIQGKLSAGHGKVLLGLDSELLILKARDLVHKKALSVRQTEKVCKLLKASKNGEEGELTADADLQYLADNLREHLRTKVRLQGTGSRGRIEISYFSASELERVLEMIGPR